MNAPRIRTLPFGLVLLTALLLACASTGPPRYWTECDPTYSNFQRHFDERGEDLDPIEGVWSSQWAWPTEWALNGFVIVRDSSYDGYDFVGVSVRRTSFGPRAVIFMALQRVESDSSVYEYSDAAVARGETCPGKPCQGVYFIAADGRLHRQTFADQDHSSRCGWIRRYPSR